MTTTVIDSAAWQALQHHVADIEKLHLRDLLQDENRCRNMMVSSGDILLDYSRQNATADTLALLFGLAQSTQLREKLHAMREGALVNRTENRAVQHMALRADANECVLVNGENVVPEVQHTRERIADFSARVRSGTFTGCTGKKLKNVIAVGIGGSYLGAQFVAEALVTDPIAAQAASERQLRFLANIDPVDLARATQGLSPDETLVVIISKTFTTAETLLNAKALRNWIIRTLGDKAVAQHMVAVSTNRSAVEAFGINPDNMFPFWDWVGGRYSVSSAVGLLPLSLHFGWSIVSDFLRGARAMDHHVLDTEFEQNIPVLMALLGIWNANFLNRPARAILPYAQALHRFAAHIQQVDMESNGKRVSEHGVLLPFEAGEICFGEPGTNSQHSFYQLIHQGRVIPADFIGFKQSQQPHRSTDHELDHHDELMTNFFAQPDALALGKTAAQLRTDGVHEQLIAHREFPGNRPSNVLLLNQLDAYSTGQLLALYEHRTAVQGFVWGINSFDQWGVELGKVLAGRLREHFVARRGGRNNTVDVPVSTRLLLDKYFSK